MNLESNFAINQTLDSVALKLNNDNKHLQLLSTLIHQMKLTLQKFI